MVNASQLQQLAARASIAQESENQPDRRDRLADDMHDLLNAVLWMLEDAGVPLPDPNSREAALAAYA
jgi:signal transduction histidine kinase